MIVSNKSDKQIGISLTYISIYDSDSTFKFKYNFKRPFLNFNNNCNFQHTKIKKVF